MAGGAGTRLWPLSRKSRPKQFQSFVDEQTLLQHMVELARTVVPIEHIFIMAISEFSQLIREQIPELPQDNLLFEPARRDTGPAIMLGMLQVHQRLPDSTVAVLWSDHLIRKPGEFTAMLTAAYAAAQANPDSVVTVGVNPTYPETGFGYIQMGGMTSTYNGVPVFAVRRFTEKPDAKTAAQYVASWDYLWNAGYEIMQAKNFLENLERVRPEFSTMLEKMKEAVHTSDRAAITQLYEGLEKMSIEVMFTERIQDILVVPSDMGWSDLGSWNALHDVLKTDSEDEMVVRGKITNVNSTNCLAFANPKRPIALVGVKDVIVVDDGDCILVMHKSASQAIKQVNGMLETTNPDLL